MRDMDRINKLIRHIQGVQETCTILAERLMANGEFKFAKALVANGLCHDNSKFFGAEWDHLSIDNADIPALKLAIMQHNQTNEHHPEFWDNGIHGMPRIYLAELLCDWKSRSAERGTSLHEWIETEAMKRFNFTKDDAAYKTITEFAKLLLEPPLKSVTEL